MRHVDVGDQPNMLLSLDVFRPPPECQNAPASGTSGSGKGADLRRDVTENENNSARATPSSNASVASIAPRPSASGST